jgi:hypothetical protein
MAPQHCPDTILEGDEKCVRFEDFTDSYLGGCLRFDVCLYRCPSGKLKVRAQMRVCGVAIGDVQEYTVDTSGTPPAGHHCDDPIRVGRDRCRLVDAYELDFGFGVKVHVCAYNCGDGTFVHGMWRLSIFGIPCRERERSSYPFPI